MEKEFFDKINILKIHCVKCLDTKLVWKARKYNDNGLGYFMILSCDYCSDYTFIDYSKTSNLKISRIPIFNVEDNNKDIYFYMIRMPTLRFMTDMRNNRDRRIIEL